MNKISHVAFSKRQKKILIDRKQSARNLQYVITFYKLFFRYRRSKEDRFSLIYFAQIWKYLIFWNLSYKTVYVII